MRIDGIKVLKARGALPKENGRPISQATLAERAGLHWVTVSNIERGKTRNTTLETAGKLASALGVDMVDLLADAPAAPSEPDDEESDLRSLFDDLLQRAVDRAIDRRVARLGETLA